MLPENESSSCDHGKSDDTDNVTKAKRPRKGRPKKLTNEDVVKRQQLDIQVVKEEKPKMRSSGSPQQATWEEECAQGRAYFLSKDYSR